MVYIVCDVWSTAIVGFYVCLQGPSWDMAKLSLFSAGADPEHRLDAHMKAAGVFPSPAGLWAWGHRMGVGFRRAVPQSELITSLLFSDTGRVSRNGVMYAGRHYSNSDVDEQQWTAYARNFGGWDIPCHHYPGSVSRIWTPNVAGQGLLDLKLSDQSTASRELTFDEVADSFAFGQLNRADVAHVKAMEALKALRQIQELVETAKAQTAAAIARDSGAKPTISEARKLEGMAVPVATPPSTAPAAQSHMDEAAQAHLDMMRAIAAAANEAQQHG